MADNTKIAVLDVSVYSATPPLPRTSRHINNQQSTTMNCFNSHYENSFKQDFIALANGNPPPLDLPSRPSPRLLQDPLQRQSRQVPLLRIHRLITRPLRGGSRSALLRPSTSLRRRCRQALLHPRRPRSEARRTAPRLPRQRQSGAHASR